MLVCPVFSWLSPAPVLCVPHHAAERNPLHHCFHHWYMALKAHLSGQAKPSFLCHCKWRCFILSPLISSVDTAVPNVTCKMMPAKSTAAGKRLELEPAWSSRLVFSLKHLMVRLSERTSGHQVGWEYVIPGYCWTSAEFTGVWALFL